MFEIGTSLREARERRGLDIAQVEYATKIRGKYLRALEEEQFELLPAQTYVKGFLRTYAEYLGLDGQLYVDEYNSRFVAGGDDHEPRVRRSNARPQRRNRRFETSVVLVALAVVAVLTIVVIAAFTTGGGKRSTPPTEAKKRTTASRPRVVPPLLEVRAVGGASQLIARTDSATGDVRYEGTVEEGKALSIRGRRLWLQLSSPENLVIRVRGTLVHVPGQKPRVIVVTSTGWRPA